ncbi:MAG: hypothetical protein K1X55_14635 [Chitinophagales bacterium]|nr:hypothetical protein [Chitinophagales bacterium]
MKQHLWKITIVALIAIPILNIFSDYTIINNITEAIARISSVAILYLIVDKSMFLKTKFSTFSFIFGVIFLLVSYVLRILHHPNSMLFTWASFGAMIIPYLIFSYLNNWKPSYRIFLIIFLLQRYCSTIYIFVSKDSNNIVSYILDLLGSLSISIMLYLKYNMEDKVVNSDEEILDDIYLTNNEKNI